MPDVLPQETTWAKFSWSEPRQQWIFCGFTYSQRGTAAFTRECNLRQQASRVLELKHPAPQQTQIDHVPLPDNGPL